MRWMPHVTVAAIVERDGRFLMVEEYAEGRLVINQPAGHLDDRESLADAVVRETLEETGWHFHPQTVTGVYRWRHPSNGQTFLRVAFSGHCDEHESEQPLDDGIVQALWLERSELLARRSSLRSPLVMRCVEDYLAGTGYPLHLLNDVL
jgi:8-oxo-dGTP pyrophosphatase MutT (NUDIX family)